MLTIFLTTALCGFHALDGTRFNYCEGGPNAKESASISKQINPETDGRLAAQQEKKGESENRMGGRARAKSQGPQSRN